MLSKRKTAASGFTLIEISLVIVIIAILIGMAVFSTQSRMDASKVYMTKQRMQTIMDAIDRYIEQYGHIPCPSPATLARTDARYGIGDNLSNTTDAGSTDCDDTGDLVNLDVGIIKGSVPFKLLGLDSQTAVDGWGIRFDYVVVVPYTNTENYESSSEQSSANIVHIYNFKDVDMSENKDVAYILLSHGPNTYGGYRDKNGSQISDSAASAYEQQNNDANARFYQFLPTSTYDDILIYKTRWQLPKYINE